MHLITSGDEAELFVNGKALATTAPTPTALPPARELLASLANVLGLEGGDHGYTQLVAQDEA